MAAYNPLETRKGASSAGNTTHTEGTTAMHSQVTIAYALDIRSLYHRVIQSPLQKE